MSDDSEAWREPIRAKLREALETAFFAWQDWPRSWSEMKDDLSQPHFGDCTSQCETCFRCLTEGAIEDLKETLDLMVKEAKR